MAEEIPFLAGQRPWERADLIACGTRETPFDPTPNLSSHRRQHGNNHDHVPGIEPALAGLSA